MSVINHVPVALLSYNTAGLRRMRRRESTFQEDDEIQQIFSQMETQVASAQAMVSVRVPDREHKS